MPQLCQLDELVIDVIIDNQSDSYSTKPSYVVPEFNNVSMGSSGGFHLVGSLEKIIPQTVEAMELLKPARIMPGHCTGWRAVCAMVNAFGEAVVVPSAVGSRYVLSL